MTPLCIYHGGCTDGVAAAWAVHSKHPDWRFYPGTYQHLPPFGLIDKQTDVYLVDFSYKRRVLEEILYHARSVTVLDHHDTARLDLEPLFKANEIQGEFDMDRCGALIAWEWFHEKEPPLLLRYIDARDRWINPGPPGLDEVIIALRSYPHTDPIHWECWDDLMSQTLDYLAQEGIAIHRYYRTLVDSAKRRAYLVTLGEYDEVPCINATFELASEVAGELAAESKHGLAFCWWREKDGSYTTSVRSRKGGPHVGKLAETWGGGGHPGAAGFRVNVPVWVE